MSTAHATATDTRPQYDIDRQESADRGSGPSLLTRDTFTECIADKERRRKELTQLINSFTNEQLDAIAAHRHRSIEPGGHDGFRVALIGDQMQPPAHRRYEIMIQQTVATTGIITPVQEQSSEKNDLAFYNRIADPLAAAEQMGNWMYKSAMLGIGTKEAGITVALTCLTERISPLEFTRRYHIIEGRPSMRSDFMLARFQELGGKVEIVQRDENAAIVDLTWSGKPTRFSFTWEQAEKEPFVRDKKGNIKTNYATARTRMQMLWARCVSDGIRTVCPQVNAGTYSPEETMDMLGKDGDSSIIDAEYQVTDSSTGNQTTESDAASQSGTSPGTPAAVAAPSNDTANSHTAKPSNREPLRENGGVSAIISEQAAKQAEMEQQLSADSLVTESQLQDLARLKSALKMTTEAWKELIANPKLGGHDSAKKMNQEQAERLRKFLRKKVDELPHSAEVQRVQEQDDLSRWADGELMPSAGESKN